jgi:hypothetical protein
MAASPHAAHSIPEAPRLGSAAAPSLHLSGHWPGSLAARAVPRPELSRAGPRSTVPAPMRRCTAAVSASLRFLIHPARSRAALGCSFLFLRLPAASARRAAPPLVLLHCALLAAVLFPDACHGLDPQSSCNCTSATPAPECASPLRTCACFLGPSNQLLFCASMRTSHAPSALCQPCAAAKPRGHGSAPYFPGHLALRLCRCVDPSMVVRGRARCVLRQEARGGWLPAGVEARHAKARDAVEEEDGGGAGHHVRLVPWTLRAI